MGFTLPIMLFQSLYQILHKIIKKKKYHSAIRNELKDLMGWEKQENKTKIVNYENIILGMKYVCEAEDKEALFF